ncbi:hypothetical protein HDU83_007451 [Entophlyctis luteolus]|nr:hypothetical protein HDU83_007451 [Entophlyctis luteolus]
MNMLSDSVRTSTYHSAIIANGPTMFANRVVMDVGAGSGAFTFRDGFRTNNQSQLKGILSFFAVKSGAQMVIAVEASGMAEKISRMLASAHSRNQYLKNRLLVLHSKVEEITPNMLIPNSQGFVTTDTRVVDTIISEPVGVLLLHERMVESFIYARDHFLKPGGAMMPESGTIHLAPFSDAAFYAQTMAKARFWENTDFYGVDFSPLKSDAVDEAFEQVAVGVFNPSILIANKVSHCVDFRFCTVEELSDIVIPIDWISQYTGIMHGIAGWFDLDLCGVVIERSYNIAAEMFLPTASSGVGGSPYEAWVTADRSDDREDEGDDADEDLRYTRRARWLLHEQLFTYGLEAPAMSPDRPETLSLYK